MPAEILHKDLSYQIVGCVFDVHNEVGPGLREECYQKAMEHRLREKGIPFLAKPATRREFHYRGQCVDVFEPDLVVADRIVLELKHHIEGFAPENVSQTISYLKFWKLDLGLLINFAMDSANIERIPFQPPEAAVEEDYDHIADFIPESLKPVLRSIREGLLRLHQDVGLGYTATTYHSLAQVEWQGSGLACESEPRVEPLFRERRLPESRISPIIVDHKVCVQVEAVADDISARAIRTMQTHLRLTKCAIGLVACFGKTRMLIRGVRP